MLARDVRKVRANHGAEAAAALAIVIADVVVAAVRAVVAVAVQAAVREDKVVDDLRAAAVDEDDGS